MLMGGISFLGCTDSYGAIAAAFGLDTKETIANTESVSRLSWVQKDGFVALQERNNWGGHTP